MPYKFFSERYEEELHSNSYGLLKDIVDELSSLLKENAYLKVENESLRESNQRYSEALQESNKSFENFIAEALTGLVNKEA